MKLWKYKRFCDRATGKFLNGVLDYKPIDLGRENRGQQTLSFMDSNSKIKCSLGVFAYNEAENIIPLLEALVNQKLEKVEIEEIIVVSSGSTDMADELVTQFAETHPQVRLIRQAKREGKSVTINLTPAGPNRDVTIW